MAKEIKDGVENIKRLSNLFKGLIELGGYLENIASLDAHANELSNKVLKLAKQKEELDKEVIKKEIDIEEADKKLSLKLHEIKISKEQHDKSIKLKSDEIIENAHKDAKLIIEEAKKGQLEKAQLLAELDIRLEEKKKEVEAEEARLKIIKKEIERIKSL